MQYKIIRGTKQIGGAVTEITSDAGTKIWIDFGCELPSENASTDEKLIQLMQAAGSKPDAVFFTHIHGDHIGLLEFIPEGVEVFIGELGKKMLDNINDTLLGLAELPEGERTSLLKKQKILNSSTTHFYKKFITDSFKDINFKALPVDHSALDSYMLLFEVDGKVLLHTGDFRDHGRMGSSLYSDIEKLIAGKQVDILITEGTTLGSTTHKNFTEVELTEEATKILKEHPYAFLICSSINIDALASFYWAAVNSTKGTEKKMALYCNSYVKKQLELFTQEVGYANDLWQYKFHRTYSLKQNLGGYLKGKTQEQHMLDNGFIMRIGISDYYKSLVERFKANDRGIKPILIYSMWEGYLTPGKPYTNQALIDFINSIGLEVIHLHTSGHATPETIAKVIKLVNPKEAIVPIHTEHAEGIKEILADDNLAKIVKVGQDVIEEVWY